MDEDKHEFVADNFGNCAVCDLPERASDHLIAPVIPIARSITFSYTPNGMNIAIQGVLDPAELALVSVVAANMCNQTLAGAAAIAAAQGPQDHKRKKGN